MIAAGVESMSMVPLMGNAPACRRIFLRAMVMSRLLYIGMGLTAKVAQQWKVSHAEAQDAVRAGFTPKSTRCPGRRRVCNADPPIEVNERALDLASGEITLNTPWRSMRRAGYQPQGWLNCAWCLLRAARSRPGSRSQTSDGAGALILAK